MMPLIVEYGQLDLAALEEQAAEFEEALADIRGKLADYGFTERDIFGLRRGGRARRRAGPMS